ncbi:PREDICTED: uncharacterized protein LOC104786330 [Camelina sativa]|uniref:Uncharacterized protein LOC104786330 n=1 Tax=Camelina sativa TaxID=90675 RepID=A0ABM0Z3R9_CAMSA|nr:PREDICTED: uncharacterized protein LOC104786330 [Camelina sativa]
MKASAAKQYLLSRYFLSIPCYGTIHMYYMDQSGGGTLSSSLFLITCRSNYQDFSEPIKTVPGTKTGVFWDINECPFPFFLDPETIFERIKLALKDRRVSDGVMSIWLYADKIIPFPDEIVEKFHKSRIYFVPQVPVDKTARAVRMLHDTQLWELDSPLDCRKQSNVIVISNDISSQGDCDFHNRLKFMSGRGYYAFLVQPVDIAQEKLTAPDWPRGVLENAFDFSITRNNVGTSKGGKTTGPWYSINTCVFWLVEETPAPSDHLISAYIRAALQRMGYIGPLSIFAFGIKEQSSIDSDPGIFFYESLDKDAIIHKMLYDITRHASSLADEKEKCLMLITKNPPKDDELLRVLASLDSRGFHVLLVQPHDEAQVFSSVDSIIQCTTLLDGSSPIDFDGSSSIDFDGSSPMDFDLDSKSDSFCCSSQSSWETDPENLDDSTSFVYDILDY